jgi:hypothetical protein
MKHVNQIKNRLADLLKDLKRYEGDFTNLDENEYFSNEQLRRELEDMEFVLKNLLKHVENLNTKYGEKIIELMKGNKK